MKLAEKPSVTRDRSPRAEDFTCRPEPVEIMHDAKADKAAADAARQAKRMNRMKKIAMWSRQLFVLVRSGTPLAEALHAVERQVPEGQWREALTDVRTRIDEGASLSEAMAHHPGWFDPICRSLMAAGESSGEMDNMLDRLSSLTRQQLRVRRTLLGSMIYPILLIAVALSVTVVLMAFVLPRFSELFETLDATLPPSTALMIAVSDAFRAYWWALLGAVAAGAVGLKIYAGTAAGRVTKDKLAVKVPLIGKMTRSFSTGKITRLLGQLLVSRVQLLEAIQLTQGTCSNSLYLRLMTDTENAVSRGENMSSVFARTDLIPPSVTEALRHGEQSGQIGPILLDMAEFIDEENEALVRTFTSLLEPIILILMGLVVGVVALSMFLPLFDLAATA